MPLTQHSPANRPFQQVQDLNLKVVQRNALNAEIARRSAPRLERPVFAPPPEAFSLGLDCPNAYPIPRGVPVHPHHRPSSSSPRTEHDYPVRMMGERERQEAIQMVSAKYEAAVACRGCARQRTGWTPAECAAALRVLSVGTVYVVDDGPARQQRAQGRGGGSEEFNPWLSESRAAYGAPAYRARGGGA